MVGAQALEANLLGTTRFRRAGQDTVVQWERPAARRLITLLVLAPDGWEAIDRLATMLFGHLPSEDARRGVLQAAAEARRRLGSQILQVEDERVRLRDPDGVQCDLRRLVDGLRHLGGAHGGDVAAPVDAFLGRSVALADEPAEPWAGSVRAELAAALHRHWVERARASDTADDWQRVFERDPTSVEASLRIATLLGRRDPERAFAVLQHNRRALRWRGLTTPPLLEVAATELRDRLRPMAATRGSTLREQERGTAVAALAGAGSTARGAVYLQGPAGLGKTHLAEEISGQLEEQGWRTSWLTVPRGTDGPVDPVTALQHALELEIPGPSDDPRLRAASGSGVAADDLHQVVRRLRQRLDDLARGGSYLLVIDDLHQAGPLLPAVLREMLVTGDRAWALLLCARSDDARSPAPAVAQDVTGIMLEPLDDAAIRTLLREATDLPAEVHHVVAQRSGGNPLLALELGRATSAGGVPTSGPLSITEIIDHRLDGLTSEQHRIAGSVALLGDTATYEVLATASEGPAARVGEVVRELRSGAVVRETPGGPRIAHPLLADRLLQRMSIQERARQHDRLAEVLERLAAGRGTDRHEMLAAAQHHRLAAFRCAYQGGEDEAARLARALLITLATGVTRTPAEGATPAAQERLATAAAAFELLPEDVQVAHRDQRAELELRRGAASHQRGDVASATRAYQAALDLAGDPVLRARAWRELAWVDYQAGDLTTARDVAMRGRDELPLDAVLARSYLDIEVGWIDARLGRTQAAVMRLRGAALWAESAGAWALAARGLDRLGMAVEEAGELAEGLALLERALGAARRAGDLYAQAVIHMHRGGLLPRAGRVDEGLTDARIALALAHVVGDRYDLAIGHWVLAEVHDARGDLPAALAARDEEIRWLEQLGNRFNLAGAHTHRASLLARLERPEEARAAARQARRHARAHGDPGLIRRIDEELAGY